MDSTSYGNDGLRIVVWRDVCTETRTCAAHTPVQRGAVCIIIALWATLTVDTVGRCVVSPAGADTWEVIDFCKFPLTIAVRACGKLELHCITMFNVPHGIACILERIGNLVQIASGST